MMKNKEVYMNRLLTAAIENNQVEVIREEIKQLLATLTDQPRFLEIFKSPTMNTQKQQQFFAEAFTNQISQTLVDFGLVLIQDEMFDYLADIGRLYDEAIVKCLDEHFHYLEGVVYSAVSLEDKQLEMLERVFTDKFGKQVKLESIVEPSLIGGYRVEISGHVYDDTIGVQLQRLEESLNHVDLN